MSDKPIRVFVALPCGELSRFSAFWKCREGLDLEGLQVQAAMVNGLYIDNNQNIAAREMLKQDFDYYWLLNDDLLLPPKTLKQLLSHKKDVVVPLVLGHEVPNEPLFYDKRDGSVYHHRYLEPGDHGLVPGLGSGGGGMLISRRVLEAIADPWWETSIVHDDKGIPGRSTEDLDFCRKVENAGFEIWCDLDCPVGHLTIFTVWPIRQPDGTWTTSLERHGKHVLLPAALNPETHPRLETPEESFV